MKTIERRRAKTKNNNEKWRIDFYTEKCCAAQIRLLCFLSLSTKNDEKQRKNEKEKEFGMAVWSDGDDASAHISFIDACTDFHCRTEFSVGSRTDDRRTIIHWERKNEKSGGKNAKVANSVAQTNASWLTVFGFCKSLLRSVITGTSKCRGSDMNRQMQISVAASFELSSMQRNKKSRERRIMLSNHKIESNSHTHTRARHTIAVASVKGALLLHGNMNAFAHAQNYTIFSWTTTVATCWFEFLNIECD